VKVILEDGKGLNLWGATRVVIPEPQQSRKRLQILLNVCFSKAMKSLFVFLVKINKKKNKIIIIISVYYY
jgi:hypothetical protein